MPRACQILAFLLVLTLTRVSFWQVKSLEKRRLVKDVVVMVMDVVLTALSRHRLLVSKDLRLMSE